MIKKKGKNKVANHIWQQS